MLQKIHILLSLFAALVVTAISILNNVSLADLSIRVITVIVLFYCLGLILRSFLTRNVFISPILSEEENSEIDENSEPAPSDTVGEQTEFERTAHSVHGQ